ncbi:MAG: hypothetical protein H6618_05760 [Deltaproteobacteria bacterium]|nr:hypothetical protein [Deltaproteobacteria bacterium]
MATAPSEIIYKFNSSRNRFILRFLLILVIILAGVMAWFYKSIPEDSMDRLLGKKRAISQRDYQTTPPAPARLSSSTKETSIVTTAATTHDSDAIILQLRKQLEQEKQKTESLQAKIQELEEETKKQKNIIKKLISE